MPPIAPRPFVQLARRCWRLRTDVPRGYLGGICNAPWYHARRRRRAAVALRTAEARDLSRRRLNRAYWRRTPLYVCPMIGEVA
jgi:hypothetical protein